MGILKFIFTFFFFYFLIKVVKTIFFVGKTVNQHKKATQRQNPNIRTPKSDEDIIDAEYTVVDEKNS